MKGFGTDEKALIRVLSDKDPLQVEAIRLSFQSDLGRDLIKDVRSETSGYFEQGLVQLIRGPKMNDAYLLYDAMDGPGTKEKMLNDILLGRSNADLNAIKQAFRATFGKALEDVVKGDLSMKTERHFMMVLAANRAEDGAPVVPQQVDDDVNRLYQATEGRMGTDEMVVCSILTQRNDNQIRAISHAYTQRYRKDLAKVIKSVSPTLLNSGLPTSGPVSDKRLIALCRRNSRATWKMLYSSSCSMPRTNTCTQPVC
jgi:annexin A7/11